MRYLVDQNMMRHPDLADVIYAEPGSEFILPDTAFVEMCKSDQWEATMRGSLAALKSVPDRVHGAIAVSYAMRRELSMHRPTGIDELLPADHTVLIRRIMAALASGGKALVEVRVEIGRIRKRLLEEQVNPAAEKCSIKHMIDAFAADAGATLVAEVRRSGRDGVFNLALIQHVAEVTLLDMLVGQHGRTVTQAIEFVASKPLLLRHHILRVREAARWIVDHGFDGVDPNRILNDRFDQEYVAVGTYFDGILTRDKRAREADRDLRMILDDAAGAVLRQIYREASNRAEPPSGD